MARVSCNPLWGLPHQMIIWRHIFYLKLKYHILIVVTKNYRFSSDKRNRSISQELFVGFFFVHIPYVKSQRRISGTFIMLQVVEVARFAVLFRLCQVAHSIFRRPSKRLYRQSCSYLFVSGRSFNLLIVRITIRKMPPVKVQAASYVTGYTTTSVQCRLF